MEYPEFKAGVYRHFKGPMYLMLGLAKDANDDTRKVVVYIGLELDEHKTGPRMSVRTYEDFYCYVLPTTKETVDKDHPGAVPRFAYVGPTWEGVREPERNTHG